MSKLNILKELICQLSNWSTEEISRERADHLNSYTHAECGYEVAQEEIQDILEYYVSELKKETKISRKKIDSHLRQQTSLR